MTATTQTRIERLMDAQEINMPRSQKKESELSAQGKSCKSCASFISLRCSLKNKRVNHYNICSYWGEKCQA